MDSQKEMTTTNSCKLQIVCKYCGEKDKSRLMTRSTVVEGKVETIDICLECWWSKEIHGKEENGKE